MQPQHSAASSPAALAAVRAQQEAELAEHIADYVDDPLGYVLFAFAWGDGDLEGEDGPDDWQRDLLQDIGDGCLTVEAALQIAVAAGHGVGKSALVAWLILWAMSTRPQLAGIVTANTKSQLSSKTWRELSVWHKRSINQHWFEWTATRFAHIQHPTTWFIEAVTWSKERPEAFAGLHAKHVLVIFDEASAIPDIIFETTEGAMTTQGAMWFCFGNPTRNTGRFRQCFGVDRKYWITKKVDARTAKKANQAKIAQWLERYGEDHDFFRIRVRGEFPEKGSTQFIASNLVDDAQRRDTSFMQSPRVLSVDVARFGQDQSVIMLRSGDQVHSAHIWKFRGMDTVQLAHRVAEKINDLKPNGVVVDGTGLGAGVVDILRSLNHKVFEFHGAAEPSDKLAYSNLRAESWGQMRDWFADGRAAIPDDSELHDDLIGIEYDYTLKGQIQLESKDDMRARGLSSPDLGDALAMSFSRAFASDEAKAARRQGTGKLPGSYREANDFANRYRRTRN